MNKISKILATGALATLPSLAQAYEVQTFFDSDAPQIQLAQVEHPKIVEVFKSQEPISPPQWSYKPLRGCIYKNEMGRTLRNDAVDSFYVTVNDKRAVVNAAECDPNTRFDFMDRINQGIEEKFSIGSQTGLKKVREFKPNGESDSLIPINLGYSNEYMKKINAQKKEAQFEKELKVLELQKKLEQEELALTEKKVPFTHVLPLNTEYKGKEQVKLSFYNQDTGILCDIGYDFKTKKLGEYTQYENCAPVSQEKLAFEMVEDTLRVDAGVKIELLKKAIQVEKDLELSGRYNLMSTTNLENILTQESCFGENGCDRVSREQLFESAAAMGMQYDIAVLENASAQKGDFNYHSQRVDMLDSGIYKKVFRDTQLMYLVSTNTANRYLSQGTDGYEVKDSKNLIDFKSVNVLNVTKDVQGKEVINYSLASNLFKNGRELGLQFRTYKLNGGEQ